MAEFTVGDLTVDSDQVDEHAAKLFSSGWCWALAEALHLATGWPVVIQGYTISALRFGSYEVPMDMAQVYSWSHVLVQRPDGKLLDVFGLSDPIEGNHTLQADVDLSFERMAEMCDDDKDMETPRTIAKAFVPAVLELQGD